ncbi:MAG: hypothetical protein M0Z77_00995 [Thermoplasmatales archaeon]|nr:hypothetical protein [Thermoplasmatales archaeon]
MGSIEVDYGIQSELDLELDKLPGTFVKANDRSIMRICGDQIEIAEDQLMVWANRHESEKPHRGPDCWIVNTNPLTIKIGNGRGL